MNLRSRGLVTLLWTLLATFILVSCETLSKEREVDTSLKSTGKKRNSKYLELEDLNSFDSPSALLVKENEEFENARPRRDTVSNQKTNVRVTRQNQKKQRPGFFWTLAKVTFQTFNDTRSAIQQISQIINNSISPDPPKKPVKKVTTPKPVTSTNKTSSLTGSTTQAPTTTTEAEFKLTRPLLQSLVRRNVKGLVRLFNIEWRDALNQSSANIQEFQRDLGKQIGMYLQDNPDNY